jgi:hypothetical protein
MLDPSKENGPSLRENILAPLLFHQNVMQDYKTEIEIIIKNLANKYTAWRHYGE